MISEGVEGHGLIRAPDDFEELEEERELLEFVESPFCIEAVMQFFAEKNTKSEEILEKAGNVLDNLITGMHTLICIMNGEIVCVEGKLYPGNIVDDDRGLT